MPNNANTLLPAYLIVGEDELKRRRAVERLRERVAQGGDLEFNHDLFDAETASGTDIATACNTLPFASELRLVEVKSLDKLSKSDQEVLVAYLASPSPSTILACSCDKLPKNTKLYKAFAGTGKKAIIDCAPMKRYQLVRALRSMAVEHGFTMTDAAAEKLVELVGEDTVRLDSELRKIALSAKPNQAVNDQLVESVVARTAEAKPWELVNALSERNLRQCLILLGLVEDAPLKLVAMCTTRMRELACAKALSARGQAGNLATELSQPAWRVKNHVRWASLYTDQELASAFSGLRDCERAIKTGADPNLEFREWLVKTVSRL